MSSDDEGQNVDNVDNALTYLENLRTNKKAKLPNNGIRVDQRIRFLHQLSSTVGLSPQDLLRLSDIIKTKNKALGSKRTIGLIYCLVPAESVPEQVVLKFIFWICTDTVLDRTKKLLFQWLVAVHCFNMESSKASITKLYDNLFCFLFEDDVSESAAHLLYILTRKKHVTKVRIRQLMRLAKDSDKQAHLTGLLTLYQVFRPEVVRIVPKIRRIFRSPVKWRDAFQRVRTGKIELAIGPFLNHCSKGVLNGFSQGLDREIETYKDFKELMIAVDTQYSVNQICYSSNVRLIFSSSRGNLLKQRFENFLQVAAYDTCLEEKEAKMGMKFLTNVSTSLNLLSREYIDGILFLNEYLDTWDGASNIDLICSLISTLTINEFPELRENILIKVEKVFYCGSVAFQCAYLECLSHLCRNWIINYLPQLNEIQLSEGEQAIRQLQNYVGKLCVLALTQQVFPNASIMAVSMEFYDMILRLVIKGHSTVLTSPLPLLVYISFFSFSPYFVSEIALLMVKYKAAIIRLKERRVNVPIDIVDCINSYIKDIAICVWKEGAHIAREDSIIFKKDFLPIDVRNSVPNANKCFVFYRHPAFLNQAMEFLRERKFFTLELEDLHVGNFEFHNLFLNFLSEKPECSGILKFLETFIIPLAEEAF